jgi:hypothetical protein
MVRTAAVLLALAVWLHPIGEAGASIKAAAARLTVQDAACAAAARSCPVRLLESAALAPGGAPARTEAVVSYVGSTTAVEVGLYLQNFEARSLASLPTCTATDPAQRFAVVISSGRHPVFSGSLSLLAAVAANPRSALHLPAPDGRSRWGPGDRTLITATVGLDRAADNSYMGCSSHAELAWLVSR